MTYSNLVAHGGHLPYKYCMLEQKFKHRGLFFPDQDTMFKYVWKGYKIHSKTKIRVCFSKLPIEKGY